MDENTSGIVYHIRRDSDSNESSGYIGITKNTKEYRLGEHKVRGNKHLKYALTKYDDIQIIQLFKGPIWLCKLHEYNLRPEPKMGWNLAIGGGKPPIIDKTIGRIRGLKGYYNSKECSLSRKKGEVTKKSSGFYASKVWQVAKNKISESNSKVHLDRLDSNFYNSNEWKLSVDKRTKSQLSNKIKKFNLEGINIIKISKDSKIKTVYQDMIHACNENKLKFSCIYNYLNKGIRYGHFWKTVNSVQGE